MAISSLSAISTDTSNPLLAKLEANGLSADKAQVVEDDLANVLSQGSASGSGPVDVKSVRAALDQKIDQDVASGKLSESDAAAVKKTLDDLDAQTSGTDTGTASSQAQSTDTTSTDSTGSTQTSSAGASGAKGGGGGGGGSSTKTELSETTTISGSLKTTIITYTDGTTSTTKTAASAEDVQKYGTKAQQTATADTASKYLSTIQPGSLFQLMA
ncbi:hypothetical protein [Novosphingobium rosa]|uniref:hypothetical protein n=1 Tax=Novosphingobium rosa TaxID=76978 RepID=UPI00082B420D|nr:hypothetical protein [Novosphingobium rosa]